MMNDVNFTLISHEYILLFSSGEKILLKLKSTNKTVK